MAILYIELSQDLKDKVEAQAKDEGKAQQEWVRGILSEWFEVRAVAASRSKASRKEGN